MTQREPTGSRPRLPDMNARLTASALFLPLVLILTLACTGPAGTPGPTPSPAPSPSPAPATGVDSAAQAAALVFASDPRFARMQPLRSDLIGQSAWYEAAEDGNGFAVTITIGAGDCEAGCIQRHIWSYHIDRDGTVTLVGEQGDDVAPEPIAGTGRPNKLHVSLTSGPTCPVERNPPDPNCAARPVVNAEVLVFDANGHQVGDVVSGADGSVTIELPDGAYYVMPAPVEGFMGQAEAQAFAAVGGETVDLVFTYDTGIR